MSQWEKVGKTKSKTKAQKQKEADKMPKQSAEVAPLEISKSMFGVFEDRRKSQEASSKKPLQDRSNAQGSPKAGNMKKTKKSKKPSPTSNFRYETFEEAIREVSVIGVYEKATEVRGKQVWQKIIINLMNDTISCLEEDPAFSNRKDCHFPLSKVDQPIQDMMKKLYVDEASEQIRQLLFDHCLMTLVELLDRGMPTWGYRLCIQTMAKYAPENCMDDVDKHLSKIQRWENSQKKCLSYLWAIGQVGIHNVTLGMQIWLTVMMPLLRVKKIADFVVRYVENLMKISKNPQKDMAQSINADQFFQIIKWTYESNNGLDSSLKKRLRSVFGTLKVIATGTLKLKLLIFERYLRTSVDEIAGIKAPLVQIAWECMQQNPECLKAWRDSYPSSLPQTKILLEHVDNKWDGLKLPKGFQGAILSFHDKNKIAAAESSTLTSLTDFKTVRTLCQSSNFTNNYLLDGSESGSRFARLLDLTLTRYSLNKPYKLNCNR